MHCRGQLRSLRNPQLSVLRVRFNFREMSLDTKSLVGLHRPASEGLDKWKEDGLGCKLLETRPSGVQTWRVESVACSGEGTAWPGPCCR